MKFSLVLISLLFSFTAAAMDQKDMSNFFSNPEVESLHRISNSKISSVKIEELEEKPGFAGNVVVILEYFPQLTQEEIENEEGPGICGARVQYSYGNTNGRTLLDVPEVKVLQNLCHQ